MPLLFLLALFVIVPIVEIYLIIQVGQAIGALPTIALLVADSILDLMMLGASLGKDIEIEAKGEDAEDALTAMVALVEARFGEDK